MSKEMISIALLNQISNKLKSAMPLVLQFSLLIMLIFGISACQTRDNVNQEENNTQQATPSQPIQNDSEGGPGNDEGQEPTENPSDPDVIHQMWKDSAHAETFVKDSSGDNMTCARCHAPIKWIPSMDDMPESCFSCKFEVKDPPPLVLEQDWNDIACKVCHQEDKNGNVQPEYMWLEIAQIEEYAQVDTQTELCQKCHTKIDLTDHEVAQLDGAHVDYECTECHNPHDLSASCGTVDCHADVIDPLTPIAGHDKQHQVVSCVACHDAGGMAVAPATDTGIWTTFTSETTATSLYSHNIGLEASCERCHFPDNPWSLTDSVNEP